MTFERCGRWGRVDCDDARRLDTDRHAVSRPTAIRICLAERNVLSCLAVRSLSACGRSVILYIVLLFCLMQTCIQV